MSPAVMFRRDGRRPGRGGFTLLEVMIVMIVIAILSGLLLVAVGGVRRTANDARVAGEITQLEGALADFKATFGSYPPSSIVLSESGTTWDSTSRGIIMSFWPTFDFSLQRDINGNGNKTDTITLKGAECLVFFLGGVRATEDVNRNGTLETVEDVNNNMLLDAIDPPSVIGFSKNPADPFDRRTTGRVGPFFNFDSGRLQPASSGSPVLVYFDPYQQQVNPYIYASAYDGRGYENTDVTGRMTSVYLTAAGGTGWNQKSFQIISPGADGAYGVGGAYSPDAVDDTTKPAFVMTSANNRGAERDNITNFRKGRLAQE